MTAQLDWGRIETVFVDMDGTLLDKTFDDRFWGQRVPEAYAVRHRLPAQEATDRVFSLYKAAEGTLDWIDLDRWSRVLSLDLVTLQEQAKDGIRVNHGVLEFLEWLRETEKYVVLVTNAHPRSVALKMQVTGLRPFFALIISAFDVGLLKESPGFWDRLLGRLDGIVIKQAVMIDDSPEPLRAAREAGVGHVLLKIRPDSAAQPDLPSLHHYRDIMG